MNDSAKKIAIIIGAGPAGLTAAYELIKQTNIKPIIFETSNDIGGISKTINYKGNYIDIGGHRFFSKSDTVMNWWLSILPIENNESIINISYQNKNQNISVDTSKKSDSHDVMLVRSRVSRILYLKKLFSYPISLSIDTLKKLGFLNVLKIGFSYIYSVFFPIKPEKNLEDFFINRFGMQLYKTFFKDYTEKVWGVACNKISSEWGVQRIKGLSIFKAISSAFTKLFKSEKSINQKKIETTLIERFLYPKYGPGQLWQKVAELIKENGGEIYLDYTVNNIIIEQNQVKGVSIKSGKKVETFYGDYIISTMPVKDLINSFNINVPKEVFVVANGLIYRDFFTVGLLTKKILLKDKTDKPIKDNWIYVQENYVKMGRIQIFNNWSPFMVSNPENIWLGLEYFCNEDEELWNMSENEIVNLAINEMEKIGVVDKQDVIDSVVIKMPKTYPAYFGTYNEFEKIRNFTDSIDNLFLIGRNGMHRYNNQDHSMLTAMEAVNCIRINSNNKSKIWEVNTEEEYHEENK